MRGKTRSLVKSAFCVLLCHPPELQAADQLFGLPLVDAKNMSPLLPVPLPSRESQSVFPKNAGV